MFKRRRRADEYDRAEKQRAKQDQQIREQAPKSNFVRQDHQNRDQTLTNLPAHQLIDLCQWYYQGSINYLEKEKIVLEKKASEFQLGEYPEQTISTDLINISIKYQRFDDRLNKLTGALVDLQNTAAYCAVLASSALSSAEYHQQIADIKLNELRDDLRRAPHLAAGLQSKIDALVGQSRERQQLIKDLQECQWINIHTELEWIDNTARRDLKDLTHTHMRLRDDARVALRETSDPSANYTANSSYF